MAWTFTNDSLNTTLCLQWEPEIVACALLYLATKLSRCEIENWENKDRSPASAGQKWWEHFVPGMSLEVMEDICHQILDLYSKPQASGGVSDGPGALPTGASTAAGQSGSEPTPRRKRKAESRQAGVGESIGTQAGGSRSSKTRAGSLASAATSATSAAGPQMPAVTSFATHASLLASSSSVMPPGYSTAGQPPMTAGDPSQYSMQYAMFSRQQQAAAAAVAAVYATSGAPHNVYQPPPPPPGGYPQSLAPPQGSFGQASAGLPIASTNPPVRIPSKPPTSSNAPPASTQTAATSGAFNPAVRITRGQRR